MKVFDIDFSNRTILYIVLFLVCGAFTAALGEDDETEGSTDADSTKVVKATDKKSAPPTYTVTQPSEMDPYEELDGLIGLESVKQEVKSMANFVKVQQARKEKGLKNTSLTYHMVFTGNPGTGKTTVARIMARIFKDLGVVSNGQLVETDRSGLIGEYVGETAPKTNAIVDKAIGGVLFIDEAYMLTNNNKEDYAAEAVATLLKRMEDDRDNFVVIVAGYTNEMKDFINSNPGLKSRFNHYIEFPDYSSEELQKIFISRADNSGYELDREAKRLLKQKMDTAVATKDKHFGNARYARNVLEISMTEQANRLAREGGANKASKEALATLKAEDLEGAFSKVKN